MVQHRRHAVESEAVEFVFVDPVAQVGEQVSQHFPVVVLVQARVPQPVIASLALTEVRILGALSKIKSSDAVIDVARRVRVHDIEQHAHAQAVRLVDQVLQVFRRPASRRHRERTRDVVAEGSVVRVLHHRHELHGVVPTGGDSRQNIIGELAVRVHLGIVRAHPNVRFVNSRRLRLFRRRVFELVLFLGRPVDAVVSGAHHSLLDRRPAHPRRHAIDLRAIPGSDPHLYPRSVLDRSLRQLHLPRSVLVPRHRRRLAVPPVKVPDQRAVRRRRRPLPVRDLPALFIRVKPVLFVRFRKRIQRSLRAFDRLSPRSIRRVPILQVFLVSSQSLVPRDRLRAVPRRRRVDVDALRAVDRVRPRRVARRASLARRRRRRQRWRSRHRDSRASRRRASGAGARVASRARRPRSLGPRGGVRGAHGRVRRAVRATTRANLNRGRGTARRPTA